MTINLIQNFNTLDYISLGVGFSLISYSLYCLITQTIPLGYKTIPLFSSVNAENTPDQSSLTSKNIDSENSFNSLDETSSIGSDTLSQYFTKDQIVNTDGTNLIDSLIQTNGSNLVDSSVQTDDDLLYDTLRELLYNNATPTTSLGEISPTEFVSQYKNDPNLAGYFAKTAEWAESISRQSSGSSTNSEILFLSKIRGDLESIPKLLLNNLSHVNEGINTPVQGTLTPIETVYYNVDVLPQLTHTNPLIEQFLNQQDV
jgi:hypothetical protein